MITINHSGDGTTVEGTSRGGPEIPALKQAGFRWGRSIDAWFLPRPWTYPTRTGRVARLTAALDAAGIEYQVDDQRPEVTTTAAEREAQQRERAEARADYHAEKSAKRAAEAQAVYDRAKERASHIPFGQPILVGHHSEGRDRRYRAKIVAGFAKSAEVRRVADHHERRAATAEVTANGPSIQTRRLRIDRNEAELRKLERQEAAHGLNDFALARLHELRDQVAHDRAEVEAAKDAGAKVYGPEDFQKGDMAATGPRSWYEVVRVNRKTLTVVTFYGQATGKPITNTLPYAKVRGQRRPTAEELAKFQAKARSR